MPRSPIELLRDYRKKRDFAKTAEPSGEKQGRPTQGKRPLRFVVQKHDATRLHYDFRLELDGVLKSWAVTKGPSADPADKRLAVRVEDHPLDYGDFEGTIPEGEYGGGTVMLWDEGTWEPVGDPHKDLEHGDLKFRLSGKRLKGEWVLVHMKGRDQKRRDGPPRENWLLIKHRDEYATKGDGLTEKFTNSVTTGRDLDGIAKGRKSRKKTTNAEAPSKVWTGGKAVALPKFREPQLATLVDEIPASQGWLFEMKYDGYRCLAAIARREVRLYTRNGNDWTQQFGRMVEPLSKLTDGSALLDGEICSFKDGRTDFSTLKEALSTSGDLVYFVFDLLEQDGKSLDKLALTERKQRLKALLGHATEGSPIQFSDHVVGNGEKVFAAMCESGFEGVIAKRGDAPYRHERSKDWLKIKCLNRQEFVIGGWRPSDKKSSFASLLIGTFEGNKLVYHGRVGTGFDRDTAQALQQALDRLARETSPFDTVPRDILRHAKWVSPELVAEIAYTELTPDGILRHPSFIGLRQDKPARKVRLETAREAPDAKPKSKRAGKVRASEPLELTEEMGFAAAEKAGVRLTSPNRVVFPEQDLSKAEIVAYYDRVAERMLPHLARRPLSLVRCPQGRSKHCFFQKHDSGSFPDNIQKVAIKEKDGDVADYLFVEDLAGVVAAVQMNTLEFHIWGAHVDDVDLPDRIIFDLDPDEGLPFEDVKSAALDIRKVLSSWGLKTFPMVTGGKGIHVIAPIKPVNAWDFVKLFCSSFVKRLETAQPERFTSNIRKVNRKGRLFVDYLRNERGSTAIAPFSTRSRQGAPCAVPISWNEVKTLDRANGFSLQDAAARASQPDPWKGYFALDQTITKAMMNQVAE